MNLFESTEKLFQECLEIMRKKNHDYAGKEAADTLHNFNYSANLAKITREQGILVRLGDKMTRIGNLLIHESAVKDECLEDTLRDAINYTAILYYSLKQREDATN